MDRSPSSDLELPSDDIPDLNVKSYYGENIPIVQKDFGLYSFNDNSDCSSSPEAFNSSLNVSDDSDDCELNSSSLSKDTIPLSVDSDSLCDVSDPSQAIDEFLSACSLACCTSKNSINAGSSDQDVDLDDNSVSSVSSCDCQKCNNTGRESVCSRGSNSSLDLFRFSPDSDVSEPLDSSSKNSKAVSELPNNQDKLFRITKVLMRFPPMNSNNYVLDPVSGKCRLKNSKIEIEMSRYIVSSEEKSRLINKSGNTQSFTNEIIYPINETNLRYCKDNSLNSYVLNGPVVDKPVSINTNNNKSATPRMYDLNENSVAMQVPAKPIYNLPSTSQQELNNLALGYHYPPEQRTISYDASGNYVYTNDMMPTETLSVIKIDSFDPISTAHTDENSAFMNEILVNNGLISKNEISGIDMFNDVMSCNTNLNEINQNSDNCIKLDTVEQIVDLIKDVSEFYNTTMALENSDPKMGLELNNEPSPNSNIISVGENVITCKNPSGLLAESYMADRDEENCSLKDSNPNSVEEFKPHFIEEIPDSVKGQFCVVNDVVYSKFASPTGKFIASEPSQDVIDVVEDLARYAEVTSSPQEEIVKEEPPKGPPLSMPDLDDIPKANEFDLILDSVSSELLNQCLPMESSRPSNTPQTSSKQNTTTIFNQENKVGSVGLASSTPKKPPLLTKEPCAREFFIKKELPPPRICTNSSGQALNGVDYKENADDSFDFKTDKPSNVSDKQIARPHSLGKNSVSCLEVIYDKKEKCNSGRVIRLIKATPSSLKPSPAEGEDRKLSSIGEPLKNELKRAPKIPNGKSPSMIQDVSLIPARRKPPSNSDSVLIIKTKLPKKVALLEASSSSSEPVQDVNCLTGKNKTFVVVLDKKDGIISEASPGVRQQKDLKLLSYKKLAFLESDDKRGKSFKTPTSKPVNGFSKDTHIIDLVDEADKKSINDKSLKPDKVVFIKNDFNSLPMQSSRGEPPVELSSQIPSCLVGKLLIKPTLDDSKLLKNPIDLLLKPENIVKNVSNNVVTVATAQIDSIPSSDKPESEPSETDGVENTPEPDQNDLGFTPHSIEDTKEVSSQTSEREIVLSEIINSDLCNSLERKLEESNPPAVSGSHSSQSEVGNFGDAINSIDDKSSVDENSTLDKSPINKNSIVDENLVDKNSIVDENSIDKNSVVDENSIDKNLINNKNSIVDENSIDKNSVVNEKSIDKNLIDNKNSMDDNNPIVDNKTADPEEAMPILEMESKSTIASPTVPVSSGIVNEDPPNNETISCVESKFQVHEVEKSSLDQNCEAPKSENRADDGSFASEVAEESIVARKMEKVSGLEQGSASLPVEVAATEPGQKLENNSGEKETVEKKEKDVTSNNSSVISDSSEESKKSKPPPASVQRDDFSKSKRSDRLKDSESGKKLRSKSSNSRIETNSTTKIMCHLSTDLLAQIPVDSDLKKLIKNRSNQGKKSIDKKGSLPHSSSLPNISKSSVSSKMATNDSTKSNDISTDGTKESASFDVSSKGQLSESFKEPQKSSSSDSTKLENKNIAGDSGRNPKRREGTVGKIFKRTSGDTSLASPIEVGSKTEKGVKGVPAARCFQSRFKTDGKAIKSEENVQSQTKEDVYTFSESNELPEPKLEPLFHHRKESDGVFPSSRKVVHNAPVETKKFASQSKKEKRIHSAPKKTLRCYSGKVDPLEHRKDDIFTKIEMSEKGSVFEANWMLKDDKVDAKVASDVVKPDDSSYRVTSIKQDPVKEKTNSGSNDRKTVRSADKSLKNSGSISKKIAKSDDKSSDKAVNNADKEPESVSMRRGSLRSCKSVSLETIAQRLMEEETSKTSVKKKPLTKTESEGSGKNSPSASQQLKTNDTEDSEKSDSKRHLRSQIKQDNLKSSDDDSQCVSDFVENAKSHNPSERRLRRKSINLNESAKGSKSSLKEDSANAVISTETVKGKNKLSEVADQLHQSAEKDAIKKKNIDKSKPNEKESKANVAVDDTHSSASNDMSKKSTTKKISSDNNSVPPHQSHSGSSKKSNSSSQRGNSNFKSPVVSTKLDVKRAPSLPSLKEPMIEKESVRSPSDKVSVEDSNSGNSVDLSNIDNESRTTRSGKKLVSGPSNEPLVETSATSVEGKDAMESGPVDNNTPSPIPAKKSHKNSIVNNALEEAVSEFASLPTVVKKSAPGQEPPKEKHRKKGNPVKLVITELNDADARSATNEKEEKPPSEGDSSTLVKRSRRKSSIDSSKKESTGSSCFDIVLNLNSDEKVSPPPQEINLKSVNPEKKAPNKVGSPEEVTLPPTVTPKSSSRESIFNQPSAESLESEHKTNTPEDINLLRRSSGSKKKSQSVNSIKHPSKSHISRVPTIVNELKEDELPSQKSLLIKSLPKKAQSKSMPVNLDKEIPSPETRHSKKLKSLSNKSLPDELENQDALLTSGRHSKKVKSAPCKSKSDILTTPVASPETRRSKKLKSVFYSKALNEESSHQIKVSKVVFEKVINKDIGSISSTKEDEKGTNKFRNKEDMLSKDVSEDRVDHPVSKSSKGSLSKTIHKISKSNRVNSKLNPSRALRRHSSDSSSLKDSTFPNEVTDNNQKEKVALKNESESNPVPSNNAKSSSPAVPKSEILKAVNLLNKNPQLPETKNSVAKKLKEKKPVELFSKGMKRTNNRGGIKMEEGVSAGVTKTKSVKLGSEEAKNDTAPIKKQSGVPAAIKKSKTKHPASQSAPKPFPKISRIEKTSGQKSVDPVVVNPVKSPRRSVNLGSPKSSDWDLSVNKNVYPEDKTALKEASSPVSKMIDLDEPVRSPVLRSTSRKAPTAIAETEVKSPKVELVEPCNDPLSLGRCIDAGERVGSPSPRRSPRKSVSLSPSPPFSPLEAYKGNYESQIGDSKDKYTQDVSTFSSVDHKSVRSSKKDSKKRKTKHVPIIDSNINEGLSMKNQKNLSPKGMKRKNSSNSKTSNSVARKIRKHLKKAGEKLFRLTGIKKGGAPKNDIPLSIDGGKTSSNPIEGSLMDSGLKVGCFEGSLSETEVKAAPDVSDVCNNPQLVDGNNSVKESNQSDFTPNKGVDIAEIPLPESNVDETLTGAELNLDADKTDGIAGNESNKEDSVTQVFGNLGEAKPQESAVLISHEKTEEQIKLNDVAPPFPSNESSVGDTPSVKENPYLAEPSKDLNPQFESASADPIIVSNIQNHDFPYQEADIHSDLKLLVDVSICVGSIQQIPSSDSLKTESTLMEVTSECKETQSIETELKFKSKETESIITGETSEANSAEFTEAKETSEPEKTESIEIEVTSESNGTELTEGSQETIINESIEAKELLESKFAESTLDEGMPESNKREPVETNETSESNNKLESIITNEASASTEGNETTELSKTEFIEVNESSGSNETESIKVIETSESKTESIQVNETSESNKTESIKVNETTESNQVDERSEPNEANETSESNKTEFIEANDTSESNETESFQVAHGSLSNKTDFIATNDTLESNNTESFQVIDSSESNKTEFIEVSETSESIEVNETLESDEMTENVGIHTALECNDRESKNGEENIVETIQPEIVELSKTSNTECPHLEDSEGIESNKIGSMTEGNLVNDDQISEEIIISVIEIPEGESPSGDFDAKSVTITEEDSAASDPSEVEVTVPIVTNATEVSSDNIPEKEFGPDTDSVGERISKVTGLGEVEEVECCAKSSLQETSSKSPDMSAEIDLSDSKETSDIVGKENDIETTANQKSLSYEAEEELTIGNISPEPVDASNIDILEGSSSIDCIKIIIGVSDGEAPSVCDKDLVSSVDQILSSVKSPVEVLSPGEDADPSSGVTGESVSKDRNCCGSLSEKEESFEKCESSAVPPSSIPVVDSIKPVLSVMNDDGSHSEKESETPEGKRSNLEKLIREKFKDPVKSNCRRASIIRTRKQSKSSEETTDAVKSPDRVQTFIKDVVKTTDLTRLQPVVRLVKLDDSMLKYFGLGKTTTDHRSNFCNSGKTFKLGAKSLECLSNNEENGKSSNRRELSKGTSNEDNVDTEYLPSFDDSRKSVRPRSKSLGSVPCETTSVGDLKPKRDGETSDENDQIKSEECVLNDAYMNQDSNTFLNPLHENNQIGVGKPNENCLVSSSVNNKYMVFGRKRPIGNESGPGVMKKLRKEGNYNVKNRTDEQKLISDPEVSSTSNLLDENSQMADLTPLRVDNSRLSSLKEKERCNSESSNEPSSSSVATSQRQGNSSGVRDVFSGRESVNQDGGGAFKGMEPSNFNNFNKQESVKTRRPIVKADLLTLQNLLHTMRKNNVKVASTPDYFLHFVSHKHRFTNRVEQKCTVDFVDEGLSQMKVVSSSPYIRKLETFYLSPDNKLIHLSDLRRTKVDRPTKRQKPPTYSGNIIKKRTINAEKPGPNKPSIPVEEVPVASEKVAACRVDAPSLRPTDFDKRAPDFDDSNSNRAKKSDEVQIIIMPPDGRLSPMRIALESDRHENVIEEDSRKLIPDESLKNAPNVEPSKEESNISIKNIRILKPITPQEELLDVISLKNMIKKRKEPINGPGNKRLKCDGAANAQSSTVLASSLKGNSQLKFEEHRVNYYPLFDYSLLTSGPSTSYNRRPDDSVPLDHLLNVITETKSKRDRELSELVEKAREFEGETARKVVYRERILSDSTCVGTALNASTISSISYHSVYSTNGHKNRALTCVKSGESDRLADLPKIIHPPLKPSLRLKSVWVKKRTQEEKSSILKAFSRGSTLEPFHANAQSFAHEEGNVNEIPMAAS